MRQGMWGRASGLGLLLTLMTAGTAAAQAPAAAGPDGAELYKRACAQCHDAGVGRAPNREQFRSMLPDRVLSAANVNPMDVLDLSFLKQLEEERKNKK